MQKGRVIFTMYASFQVILSIFQLLEWYFGEFMDLCANNPIEVLIKSEAGFE